MKKLKQKKQTSLSLIHVQFVMPIQNYMHIWVEEDEERNPQMMIGLCGCMMQEEHVIEKIRSSYKFVDIIFGTHNIFKLAELLKARVDSKGMIVDIWKDTDQIVEDLPSDRKFSFKCGVNIMYGCITPAVTVSCHM